MANTIKVNFWVLRAVSNKENLSPLKIRLTYQSKQLNKATGFYVNPDEWNTVNQRLNGKSESVKQINRWIDATLEKVDKCFRESGKDDNIHLPTIMESLFNKPKEYPTLLQTIKEHNDLLKLRIGKDYTYSTYEKYVFTFDKVKAFLEKSLKKKDIYLKDLTLSFIMDFDHYLRVNDNNQHNTAVKYCINLKHILNVAVMQGLIGHNPCIGHKTSFKDTPQVYLNQDELDLVETVELTKTNFILVRDLFIFQCNTGLAYTDMVALKKEDISTDISGRKWIIKARQKSGIVCMIPLLPKALDLIEKYDKPVKTKQNLFPCYSIQKYNEYIGDVGKEAKLHKKLSSHVGRRTFGNIGLAKGLSLNVISKILGHSNTLITQRIYAITTQNIIEKEIHKWI